MSFRVSVIAGLLASGLPLAALAQDVSIGQQEYMNSCAQCHGPEGKGDGFLVDYFLETGSADLTGIQKANGGVFPVSDVYAIIDGSAAAGIHGDSKMPAWGHRYSVEAEGIFGQDFALSTESREAIVRGRILALIDYISTLQAD